MKQPRHQIFSLGLTLTIIAALSAIIAPIQMIRSWYADFPCGDLGSMYPEALTGPSIHIAYCIDYIGRHVTSGAGIYAHGNSEQDSLTIKGAHKEGFKTIILERDGQTLKVNGHSLTTDQSFTATSWFPSLNPWLLYANYLTIRNAGLDNEFGTLLVKGKAYESWLPNPIGLIALIAGIKLIGISKREIVD